MNTNKALPSATSGRPAALPGESGVGAKMQEKLAEQVQLRNTPRLDFQADTKFRKTMDTLNIISQVTEELREKEQAQAATPSDETAES